MFLSYNWFLWLYYIDYYSFLTTCYILFSFVYLSVDFRSVTSELCGCFLCCLLFIFFLSLHFYGQLAAGSFALGWWVRLCQALSYSTQLLPQPCITQGLAFCRALLVSGHAARLVRAAVTLMPASVRPVVVNNNVLNVLVIYSFTAASFALLLLYILFYFLTCMFSFVLTCVVSCRFLLLILLLVVFVPVAWSGPCEVARWSVWCYMN